VKGEEVKDAGKALPPEGVQPLTRRCTWRASAAVVHDVTVIAVAAAAALYFWPDPIMVLLSILVIGTRQHALLVIAHDAERAPA
jgi:fatty acid desaturase